MNLDPETQVDTSLDTVDAFVEHLGSFDNIYADWDDGEIYLEYHDRLFLPPPLVSEMASFGYVVHEAAITMAVFRRADDMDIQVQD